MDNTNKLILIILGAIILACNASPASKKDASQIQYEFGEPGHFSYAPSAIEWKHDIRYIFVCHNKKPYEIKDHVFVYKGIPTDDGYVWQPGQQVLGPSESGWDHIHTCDPDVRRLPFTYNGEQYDWIMFYLGVDRWDTDHNQIGLAFSKNIEGPYKKFDGNPVVTFSDTTQWGVGQSTSVVLDSSTVQLFYHKSPGTFRTRKIKFSKDGNIDLEEERIIPNLSSNTYIAYSKDDRYAVSEIRIDQSDEIPTWVGNHLRLTKKPLSEKLATSKNKWEKIGLVGPDDTGFPRNHNPGFLTDPRGYLESEDEITVYFTVSQLGENWIWSYDMYSAQYNF